MNDGAQPITLVVIDDHQMFADSLIRLISDEADLLVVGVAATGAAGIEIALGHRPNVVLVDYSLPDTDGVQVAAEILRAEPGIKIIMVTGSADDRLILAAIEAGCSGYLTKNVAAGEVTKAVRLVAEGEALISPRELARLLPRLSRSYHSLGSDLTDREREILALLTSGSGNPAIAEQLHLSVNTVRNYVQGILTKLGAHSKLEAVVIAVREGLVSFPTYSNG